MAMGNLNKSKETKPTTNTALKLEDHYPKELKFPLPDTHHFIFFSKTVSYEAWFTIFTWSGTFTK